MNARIYRAEQVRQMSDAELVQELVSVSMDSMEWDCRAEREMIKQEVLRRLAASRKPGS